MKKWFPLVVVVALASISTSLEASIFDRLVNDTTQEPIPPTDGASEVVDPSPVTSEPAPTLEFGHADHGSVTLGFGYPFKTGCCEPRHPDASGLWLGFCHSSHGARGHACKGGCGKGHCGHGCGKGGCSTGKCGHGIAYGKGFAHVQQSHVQRNHLQWGHVQHGKGFSGCSTCGKTRCGCHAKGHHQKRSIVGYSGKSFGTHGRIKGQATGSKGLHFRFGLFDRPHHCGTCGKSAGIGFGKGGCGCGGADIGNGWSQKGRVIWDQGQPVDDPQNQPTPAYDPPVELNIPDPTNSLPVPPTPTGHSANIRRLPPISGYQY